MKVPEDKKPSGPNQEKQSPSGVKKKIGQDIKTDREINGKPFKGEGLVCINNSLIFAKLKDKPVDDKL